MIFITETGSKYEIHPDRLLIRRLEGVNPPTDHQGEDGTWQGYVSLSHIKVGYSAVIIWSKSSERISRTITSHVVKIIEDTEADAADAEQLTAAE